MDIMASVAGFPCCAPAPGTGPGADGYPQRGAWAGGDISATQPVASRPLSQCGDDTQDDSAIGGLEKQIMTQQDDFSEPHSDGHASPL